MNIDISAEKFKDIFLVIATPMYGGQCFGTYAESILRLQEHLLKYGVRHEFVFMYNESLITRARSLLAATFMQKPDSTHLLFIDSDIAFSPMDILAMLTMSIDEPVERPIICAPYPKKDINWKAIKRAVDLGYADKDERILENYVGNYVFNTLPGTTTIDLAEPFEVLESGTGMMLIRRKVFEDFDSAYPELQFMPNSPPQWPSGPGNELMMYFDTVIDPITKHYLSEDYMFCRYARKLGHKVWLCGWIDMAHTGTYKYNGRMSALTSLTPQPKTQTSSAPIIPNPVSSIPLGNSKSMKLRKKFK